MPDPMPVTKRPVTLEQGGGAFSRDQ
ncbi:hypothetical protein NOCARDAX2BIS_540008 [Nocardioides sp. AX2bis]|nr:hypothetical protein NOCARDAX2BIS_540008 [Nocardioides sp. AX2bis]